MTIRFDERGRLTPWAASILAGLALITMGWETPREAVTSNEDAAVPTAAAMAPRSLERAPLVRIRQLETMGCLQHTDPTKPCAMYAPGYKPVIDHEDTPDPNNAGEFVVTGGKWPQPGGLGTTVNITYSYSNLLNGGMTGGLSAAQLKAGVQEALGVWAAVSPLNFTEVADSGPAVSDTSYSAGSTPNLRIGHHTFDGAFGVLAHAYFPNPGSGLAGDLHFDNAEPWAVAPSGSKIDFIEVAVHEFGHALGLNHEPSPPAGNNAIMNPFYGSRYSGPGSAFLLTDDQNGIRAVYGSSGGGGCPIIAIGNAAKLLPFAKGLKLGAVAAPEKLYTNLRQYRDRVLQGTPEGRKLVAAYYQHGPEVIQVMAKRPDLTVQAIELLAAINDPVARRDARTEVVRMPKSTFDRGVSFLKELEVVVSEEARQAIVRARAVLDQAHSVDGEVVALDFQLAQ